MKVTSCNCLVENRPNKNDWYSINKSNTGKGFNIGSLLSDCAGAWCSSQFGYRILYKDITECPFCGKLLEVADEV